MAAAADIVQTVLLAGGGTTVGAAVVAFLTRKKTSADIDQIRSNAAKTMTDAATVLVQPLTNRVQRLERREALVFRLLERHGGWDRLVAEELRSRHVVVPDPPPLYLEDDNDPAPTQ